MPGDDDDLGLRLQFLEPVQQVEPVHVGQQHVGDDRVGPPRLEQVLSARADEGRADLILSVLQQDLEPLGHRRLIVDDEDTLLAFDSHCPAASSREKG